MSKRRHSLNLDAVDHFERIAKADEDFHTFTVGVGDARAPSRLLLASKLVGQPTVLDVGCGPGIFAQTLADERWPGMYRGIDSSAEMVAKARASFPLRTFDVGNVEALLYLDRQFSAVVVRHVLEHLWDFREAIAECARVCASRLLLVLSQLPNDGAMSWRTDTFLGVPRWSHAATHLRAQVEAQGFVLVQQDDWHPQRTKQLIVRESFWMFDRGPLAATIDQVVGGLSPS